MTKWKLTTILAHTKLRNGLQVTGKGSHLRIDHQESLDVLVRHPPSFLCHVEHGSQGFRGGLFHDGVEAVESTLVNRNIPRPCNLCSYRRTVSGHTWRSPGWILGTHLLTCYFSLIIGFLSPSDGSSMPNSCGHRAQRSCPARSSRRRPDIGRGALLNLQEVRRISLSQPATR
ncbi:hypothetical protein FA13DRAFT_1324071 [Coprinellus micaceus]|uniref:Uncharacterized protein n=1 Tax=Coprinellus micaceus TaxID=71717 RepID=A0A4Y7SRI7_COPMI|nr:hypothetical protein FA13DRAFT_1324071 [Coprinellus micaceus]